MKPTYSSHLPLWLAILLTLVMVIVVRESAVIVCDWLGIKKAANVVWMVDVYHFNELAHVNRIAKLTDSSD